MIRFSLSTANPADEVFGRHKGEKPQARANKRLTEQTRKILGKHYASKYRVR
jgi:hypothetical protein